MNVLDILFPHQCPICREVKGEEEGICQECSKNLVLVTEPTCARCGRPILAEEGEYCKDCAKTSSVLTKGTALWLYDDGTRKAIADFKYDGCTEDSRLFAKEFVKHRAQFLHDCKLDGIIPVPLHRKKRWFRGFNQATCLARELGKYLEIPVLEDALIRQVYTAPQKSLDSKRRLENLKNTMALSEKYQKLGKEYSRVLLVDDIYTTGATMESCGMVLKEAGVEKIYFACLCIGKDY